MKKLLSLLLVALLAIGALSLAACFPSETPDNGGETPVEYDLEGAKEFLLGYFEDESTVTPSDYTVPAQLPVGNYNYVVTWTVDRDDITITVENGMAKIDLNEKTPEEITYTLTATIADGDGNTTTYTRTCTIPAYEVLSYEDYVALAKGEVATIEGVIVMINSKDAGNKYNRITLVDANGNNGYYCHNLKKDPIKDLGLEVGMTVSVTGTTDDYNGMRQLKDGEVKIVNAEKTATPAVDVTAAFAAGTDLGGYIGNLVTIKGVTIDRQVLGGTNEYLYFTLGNVEGYLRTYVTDFPHTMSHAATDNADKNTIDEFHAANRGNTADVTGVLVRYGANFYLVPMNTTPFTNITVVELSDEDKVDIELEAITLPGAYSADAEVTVPTVGNSYPTEAVIAWASNNAAIVYADGKLTITVPETDALTVEVTVTVTVGEVTKTKTFTITLSKAPITIPEALALADGSNVLVSGTVVKINTAWSDQYNNISVTIADEEGNELYLYRLATNVVVGDVITVKGVMATYNNARQVAAGATAEITDPAPVEVSLTEAVALADGRRVIVKGTVKTIDTAWSEQYGNITVTIEDEAGNTLYIYRLKTNVQVGDTVIITGKVGSYNGAKQIAAGATAEIVTDDNTGDDNTGDDNTGDDNTGDDNTGDTTVVNTIPGALAAADNTAVVVSGTVVSADTWNTQFNNMSVTIKDADGNTLYVYRLATQVKIGDVITVTGVMTTYSNARQVAAGATATIDVAHVCSTYTDATCTLPATCTVCGTTNGDPIAHNYVNGVCTGCNKEEPTVAETTVIAKYTGSTTTNMAADTNNAATIGLDAALFTVTANKCSQNNNVGLNKAGNIRLYGSSADSNGNELTIAVAAGYEIKTIKVTFVSASNCGTMNVIVDGNVVVTNTTATVCTATINASSFTLKNVNASNTQLHIASIEIVYAPVA